MFLFGTLLIAGSIGLLRKRCAEAASLRQGGIASLRLGEFPGHTLRRYERPGGYRIFPFAGNSLSFTEELRHELDSRPRILFHYPVAGVRHDPTGDIDSDEAQIVRHSHAEGFLGAEG